MIGPKWRPALHVFMEFTLCRNGSKTVDYEILLASLRMK